MNTPSNARARGLCSQSVGAREAQLPELEVDGSRAFVESESERGSDLLLEVCDSRRRKETVGRRIVRPSYSVQ